MFQLVTPWTPGFVRMPTLGQQLPSVAPTPGAPSAPSNGGSAALGVVGALIALGIGSVGVLFSYGVARESKSGMVRTTGYILAGTGALMALINAGAIFFAASKA